jgi:acetyltransferase-like isoleucine patch superfamily enzyme
MSYSNSHLPLDLTMGRYCSVAWAINFIAYDHPWKCLSTSIFTHDRETDLTQRALRDFVDTSKPIQSVPNPQRPQVTIDHDVWIGQSCSLRSGIKIGTGSIVAANSVVTKDVEPYSIVGGNPARLIKNRFPMGIIGELLSTKWWDYNFADFCDLDLGNPENFIRQFSDRKPDLAVFTPTKVRLDALP